MSEGRKRRRKKTPHKRRTPPLPPLPPFPPPALSPLPSPVPRRRVPSGKKALFDIFKAQRSTHNLIPFAAFDRFVRSNAPRQAQYSQKAMRTFQEAVEMFVIRQLSLANLAAIHGKRVTLGPKDLSFIEGVQNILASG